MNLSNKVAIVTGGASRVGRGIVDALAKEGCNIFIHYYDLSEAPEEAAGEVRKKFGVKTDIGQADLGDFDSSKAASLIKNAADKLGAVQVLVNSASGFLKDNILDAKLEEWNRTLNISLTAPMLLTQAMAKLLPSKTSGVVVNVTDWRTARPYTDHFSYLVAKGGLDTLTRAAAVQLAPNIRVNAVALGAILPPPGEDISYLDDLVNKTVLLERAGGVEVVGNAVVNLIRNDFITGEIVKINGGAHLI